MLITLADKTHKSLVKKTKYVVWQCHLVERLPSGYTLAEGGVDPGGKLVARLGRGTGLLTSASPYQIFSRTVTHTLALLPRMRSRTREGCSEPSGLRVTTQRCRWRVRGPANAPAPPASFMLPTAKAPAKVGS